MQVKVTREGSDTPLTFNLVRDEISRSSVPDAFWLKPGIAYIKIDQFNDDTCQDMDGPARKAGREEIRAWCSICATIPAGC